jgi:LPXTG-motif cell wall-anchored protein
MAEGAVMNRALVVAAVALLGVAAVATASSDGADACHSNEKVTICHATSSETNPYTQITVDQSSIINLDPNGHGTHERDIIPPFNGFTGQNWDAAGQAVWNNDCELPEPQLEEVTPLAPTATEPTCDAPGDVTVPTVAGVDYTKTVEADGSVVVTAAAENGYVLTAGSTTRWTFGADELAQLPADHPDCVDPPEEVMPLAVAMTGPTCDAPGDVIVPTVEGVEYTTTVHDDGAVTVTAAAADGCVLADGCPTEWSFTAAQLAQLPADHPDCVAVLPPTEPEEPTVVEPVPEATSTDAVDAAPATLPATGGETWAILLIGLTTVLAGTGLYRLSKRPA